MGYYHEFAFIWKVSMQFQNDFWKCIQSLVEISLFLISLQSGGKNCNFIFEAFARFRCPLEQYLNGIIQYILRHSKEPIDPVQALPVCVRLCRSSWLRLANALSQDEQLKTRGFWELGEGPGWWTRSCSWKNSIKTEGWGLTVFSNLGQFQWIA